MADAPVITCPECKKKFKGKGNLTGKKIKCPFPACGKPFVVGAPDKGAADKPAAKQVKADAKSEAVKPAPAAAAASALKFEDEEDDKNPYGVTELDIAARCPVCAQLMADEEAYVCLYCGYNTLTREMGKTVKLVAHTGGERFKHLLPGLLSAFGALFFIGAITFFSVCVPDLLDRRSWVAMFDHEGLRMWFTFFALLIIYPCCMFAYKRLIINPTPEEKNKE